MGLNIKLRDYQEYGFENGKKLREMGKRLIGYLMPTGSGKSFLSMEHISEIIDENEDGKILFLAPKNAVIAQFQRHLMNALDPSRKESVLEIETEDLEGDDDEKIQNTETTKFIKERFKELGFDIEFHCYKYLENKSTEHLKNMMKGVKATFLDESHRAVAEGWGKQIKTLFDVSTESLFIPITATSRRDVDGIDAMEMIAKFSGDYSKEEIETEDYLAADITIEEAIRDGYVNEPEVHRFDAALDELPSYKKMEQAVEREGLEDELTKKLREYKDKIDRIIGKVPEEKKDEAFAKFFAENLNPNAKKGLVFIPPFRNTDDFKELDSTERQKREKYIQSYVDNVKKILDETGKKARIKYLYSALQTNDAQILNEFEDEELGPDEISVIIAINKLSEGVHVDGIDFSIVLRNIGEGDILFSQLNGRMIHGIQPGELAYNHKTQIFDRYNNFYRHKNLKEEKPRIEYDLRKIREIKKYIDETGHIPNPNSHDIIEARLALNLKRIIEEGYSETGNKKYKKCRNEIRKIIKENNYDKLEIEDRVIEPTKEEIIREGFYDLTETEQAYEDALEELNNTRMNNINAVFGILDIMCKEVLASEKKEATPENIREAMFKLLPDYTTSGTETVKSMMERALSKKDPKVIERIQKNYIKYLDEKGIKIKDISLEKELEDVGNLKVGKKLKLLQRDFFNGISTFDEYKLETLIKYRIFPSINYDVGNIKPEKILEYIKGTGNKSFRITNDGFIIQSDDKDTLSEKYFGVNSFTLKKVNETGHDIKGYKDGYDKDGYDENGFNKDLISRETKTRVSKRGYAVINGECINLITRTPYDIFGYDIHDKTEEGWDRNNHLLYGKIRSGYKSKGELFDEEGNDQFGEEKKSESRKRFALSYGNFLRGKDGIYYAKKSEEKNSVYDLNGRDVEGFDRDEFKKVNGKQYNKYTSSIFDKDGRTKDYYEMIRAKNYIRDWKTFNEDGKNRFGFDKAGLINGKEYDDRGFKADGTNIYTGTTKDVFGLPIDVKPDYATYSRCGIEKTMGEAKNIYELIKEGKKIDELILEHAIRNKMCLKEAEYDIKSIIKRSLDIERVIDPNQIPKEYLGIYKCISGDDAKINTIENFFPGYKANQVAIFKENNRRERIRSKNKNNRNNYNKNNNYDKR